MIKMFTVAQLCQAAGISQQTFYRLKKTDQDFNEILESNTKKISKSLVYGEPVRDWLLEHYSATGDDSTPSSSEIAGLKRQIGGLQHENDGLKLRVQALEEQLEAAQREKQELLTAHNHLLLLFSQEKSEKQALLPPPRVPFTERIKGLFRSKANKEG